MLVCAICVQRFYHENTAVVAIVSSTMFVMLISDVWVPVLFYIIIDLINFYNYKLEVCARHVCYALVGLRNNMIAMSCRYMKTNMWRVMTGPCALSIAAQLVCLD
jgi:hypothetical protein